MHIVCASTSHTAKSVRHNTPLQLNACAHTPTHPHKHTRTCIQVWSIRVDVHVLDSGGNLIDACCLAALAALLGFRKPQVEVDQSKGEGEAQVTVFSPEVGRCCGCGCRE